MPMPTGLLVHIIDMAGVDRSAYFASVVVGDTLVIDNGTRMLRVLVTGTPVDHGDYWEFPYEGDIVEFECEEEVQLSLGAGIGVAGPAGPAGPTGPLDILTDVDTSTVPPTVGQALVWDGTSLWKPGTVAGGGGSALAVEEVDGSPTHAAVTKLVFPNDSVSIAGTVATVRQVPTGFVGVRAYRSTTQAITTGQTAIGFDVDERDTDGIHDTVTNNSRFYVPAGMSGWWAFGGNVYFSGIGTSNWASLRVRLNGGATVYAATRVIGLPADAVLTEVHDVQYLTAGDYIELTVESDDTSYTVAISGPTLPHFYMYKIDAGRAGQGIGANVYNSAVQSMPNTASTVTTYDSEDYDTDGFHSTSVNPGRLTIPAGLGGKYLIVAAGRFDTGGGGPVAELWLRKGGTASLGGSDGGLQKMDGNTYHLRSLAIADLAAGEYVEAVLYQSNGAARNYGFAAASREAAASFSIARLDSGSNALYPPGYEYDYVENTGSGTVSATSAATAGTIITGSAVTYDGVTKVLIEMFFHRIAVGAGSGAGVFFNLYDGSTDIGVIGMLRQNAATDTGAYGARRLTPSAGSHTYSIRGWRQVANGGWGGITGNDVPSFIRITKV